jgi:hypothetical protein
MLSLNIKSKNYMCIDIDPDSVIHEQLEKKITSTDSWTPPDEFDGAEYFDSKILRIEEEERYYYNGNPVWNHPSHGLTKLPSFHINLGKPPEELYPSIAKLELAHLSQLQELIGLTILSDIKISEKENKKSAWIDIGNPKDRYPSWLTFSRFTEPKINDSIYPVENYLLRKNGVPHITLANRTGKQHDSIARPENCIVDTINLSKQTPYSEAKYTS